MLCSYLYGFLKFLVKFPIKISFGESFVEGELLAIIHTQGERFKLKTNNSKENHGAAEKEEFY